MGTYLHHRIQKARPLAPVLKGIEACLRHLVVGSWVRAGGRGLGLEPGPGAWARGQSMETRVGAVLEVGPGSPDPNPPASGPPASASCPKPQAPGPAPPAPLPPAGPAPFHRLLPDPPPASSASPPSPKSEAVSIPAGSSRDVRPGYAHPPANRFCYQLPGMAARRTHAVISPLIAPL